MFTRYKGIDIPENYSGSRFKAPIITETKTHKPTPPMTYSGTKTSISPAFEDALREQSVRPIEKLPQEFDQIFTEENIDEVTLYENENSNNEEEKISEKSEASNKGDTSLLGEFGNLFSQIFSKIKQDDLVIIGVILLLLSEKNEDNYAILPLLILLLYS